MGGGSHPTQFALALAERSCWLILSRSLSIFFAFFSCLSFCFYHWCPITTSSISISYSTYLPTAQLPQSLGSENEGLALLFLCMAALPITNSASTSPLQALKMLAIASSSEIPTFITGRDSIHPLFDAQMTREIFASIDSATRPGSESLLLAVPAAVILMLNTEGSGHHPPNSC